MIKNLGVQVVSDVCENIEVFAAETEIRGLARGISETPAIDMILDKLTMTENGIWTSYYQLKYTTNQDIDFLVSQSRLNHVNFNVALIEKLEDVTFSRRLTIRDGNIEYGVRSKIS